MRRTRNSGILATAVCLVASSSSMAEVLTFPASLTIQHDPGTGGTFATSYVEVGGYRLIVGGSGMSLSAAYGGLWIGGAVGVAQSVRIFRPDGRNFAMRSVRLQEHPLGAFGVEHFLFVGYDDAAHQAAARVLVTDGELEHVRAVRAARTRIPVY